MAEYNRAINRIFTKKVMSDLIKTGSNEIFDYVIERYIDDPEDKTNGELISQIYSHLGKSYRNEYYYTNTLLNKLITGIHSVNTTTALSQIRVADHIADFVMINGEGRVYEIKSDLDNFDRLNDQLSDYFKAFSKVSVLAAEHEREHVEIVLDKLGEMGSATGIYVLSDKDTIFSKNSIREPKEYNEQLDYRSIFTLLRKQEYQNVIMKYFHELPDVAPVFHFRTCLEMFSQIPILEAQKLALAELKKRNKIKKSEFDSIPKELKSVVYFSGLSNDLEDILKLLQQSYRR